MRISDWSSDVCSSDLPGARLPHIFLEDGSSVHDKLGLFFTLLAVDDVDSGPIEAAARAAGVPLETVRLRRPDLLGLYERNLLLVRPDQHVAWRGDALPQDIEGPLRHVTGRGGNEDDDPQEFQEIGRTHV